MINNMKLKNLYYIIWSDIIARYKKKNADMSELEIKSKLLILVSFINSLSISVIVLLLQLFNLIDMKYHNIISFSSERTNGAFTYFIYFFMPCIAINYLLIFRKNRYLKLIEIYSTPKNNYGNIYISIVLIFCVISVFIHGVVTGNIFKI